MTDAKTDTSPTNTVKVPIDTIIAALRDETSLLDLRDPEGTPLARDITRFVQQVRTSIPNISSVLCHLAPDAQHGLLYYLVETDPSPTMHKRMAKEIIGHYRRGLTQSPEVAQLDPIQKTLSVKAASDFLKQQLDSINRFPLIDSYLGAREIGLEPLHQPQRFKDIQALAANGRADFSNSAPPCSWRQQEGEHPTAPPGNGRSH